MANESTPFDENCPVMYTHDDGMKWVWLKTERDREVERTVMKHGVGQGNYNTFDRRFAEFSLRDQAGMPHVTMILFNGRTVVAAMKGGYRIDRESVCEKHVSEFKKIMTDKMTMQPKGEGAEHLIWWNGDEEWYLDGVCHRTDGPALDYVNGTKCWLVDGKRHRLDGPAVEWADGSKEWWKNGKLHREDGPAIESVNGDREWWVDGERHRESGPAIDRADGFQRYYLNGKHMSKKDFDSAKESSVPSI